MIKRIESLKNPLVRRLIALQTPARARQEGVFVLEGSRAVAEVCEPWIVESIWVSDTFLNKNPGYIEKIVKSKDLSGQKTDMYQVPDTVFAKIAETMNPQGVLAVVQRYDYTTKDMEAVNGLWIVLENLQDPGNAGTILRTADACGATGILCTKGTVDFYNSKVVRAAMGSLFHIPFVTMENMESIVDFVKAQNAELIGTHLRTDHSHLDVSYAGPTAIIVGNEGSGMTEKAAAMCTKLVRIPMPGRAESLNASVAAAVMMYEVVRQRMTVK